MDVDVTAFSFGVMVHTESYRHSNLTILFVLCFFFLVGFLDIGLYCGWLFLAAILALGICEQKREGDGLGIRTEHPWSVLEALGFIESRS